LLSCGGLVETYVSVTDKKSGSYEMMPAGFSCGRYFVSEGAPAEMPRSGLRISVLIGIVCQFYKKSQQYFFIISLFGEILMDVTIDL
jgi:hypothetical protein